MDSRPNPRRARRRPRINRHALTDTTHASDGLGVLGTIVHPVAGAGRLLGTVYREGRRLGAFEVIADDDSELPQLNLDLFGFGPGRSPLPGGGGTGGPGGDAGGGCCDDEGKPEESPEVDGPRFRVKPEGYLVFHVSWGRAGYHVTLAEPAEEGPKTVFDSRRLAEGDLFALTLLRPGRYEVRTRKGRGSEKGGEGSGAAAGEPSGQIRVAYPTPGRTSRRPEGPARISVEDGALEPAKVEVDPAQGLVFECRQKECAIAVELVEPDDGPDGTSDPKRPDARSRRNPRHAKRGRE